MKRRGFLGLIGGLIATPAIVKTWETKPEPMGNIEIHSYRMERNACETVHLIYNGKRWIEISRTPTA